MGAPHAGATSSVFPSGRYPWNSILIITPKNAMLVNKLSESQLNWTIRYENWKDSRLK